MRAAVVNTITNLVENVIVADASRDPAPIDCFLVNVTDTLCDIGWEYVDGAFVEPNDPPVYEGIV